jgi:DNA-directed RNA polymerase subunit RPC12/RpoP
MKMDKYTIDESQYKNGYRKGYEDGKKDAVKHGRWVWWVEERPYFTSYDEDYGYVCSECGTKAEEWGVDGDIPGEPPTRLHYCPICGSDMQEPPKGE